MSQPVKNCPSEATKVCLYISSRPWLEGIKQAAWKQKMSLSRFFVTSANFFLSTRGTREKIEAQEKPQ